MALPRRSTFDQIQKICNYLAKKPTGATLRDAKTVLSEKDLTEWSLAGVKYWGLVEEEEGRLKVTQLGRDLARGGAPQREDLLRAIIKSVPAYNGIVERALHRKESALTASDVGSHWHNHFKNEASSNEHVLLEQVNCFFQLAETAGIGTFVVGRKGAPTRFEFNLPKISEFVEEEWRDSDSREITYGEATEVNATESNHSPSQKSNDVLDMSPSLGQGIFIAHGKNKKPLEQLKKILDQFKVPYKVAIDEPNLGRPISGKVREIMQSCNCAILIFTADEEFKDKDGNTVWRPSENVIYELGAALYLYDNRVVVIKEENVVFPTNYRELGYISFTKDQLEAQAMDVLRELIGFGIVKIST